MKNYIPENELTHQHDESDADSAATITITPAPEHLVVLEQVAWSYSSTPTGGSLNIAVDGTTIFDVDITEGGPGFLEWANDRYGGKHGDPNDDVDKNMVVTLAAGGSGIVGKLNTQSK